MILAKLTRNLNNNAACTAVLVVRGFKTAAIGKESVPKEQQWNYRWRRYGLWGQFFDKMVERIGENTLIFNVEGNFGSGKSKFAAELAKAIRFKHANTPDLDKHMYTLDNGHSMRDIVNEMVGDNRRFRLDSLEEWHREPTYKRSISMQLNMYRIKWMQYRTACIHMLSTGDGVITERSPFSDQVIAQALNASNLFSSDAYAFYNQELFPYTIIELWKPHLVIYINKSPEECLKTIKQVGKPYERDSKVYNLDFLRRVEANYRNYLSYIGRFAHVLEYDANDLNMERILEDIELLDFYDKTKFPDWTPRKEYTIGVYRAKLSDKAWCNALFDLTRHYLGVKELVKYGQDVVNLDSLVSKSPKAKSAEYEKLEGAKGMFAFGRQAPIERDWFA